jgi:hypothetical protein
LWSIYSSGQQDLACEEIYRKEKGKKKRRSKLLFGYAHTSIKIPRSTTMLVTYPRTRPIMLRATDEEPMSTSICNVNGCAVICSDST